MEWWPFRRAEKDKPVEERKAILGTSDATGAFLTLSTKTAISASSAMNLYDESTSVSIPINIVAEAFSVVEPALKIDNEIVPRHDVLDFLKNPSPHYDQELFLETLAKNYLVTGENIVVALGRVNQPPLELQPISPKNATPIRGSQSDAAESWFVAGNTLTGNYKAKNDGRRIRYLGENSLRELKHTRNFSSRDNSLLRGRSLLVPAAKEAWSHILGVNHNVSLLEKGGRVSLVFHFSEDLSPEDFEAAKERVQEQFGGASKAGSIGMTSGGDLTVSEFGQSNKDMDWTGLQMMAVKSMALIYHVPLPLIIEIRQTFSNYKEAKLALYDDAVLPLSKRIFGGLRFILPRFGLDPSRAELIMNPDSVTALVARRNDELSKRSQIGIETDNELRAMLGREPYEGGDVIYKPAAMIPVGSDVFLDDNEREILEDPNELGGAGSD